MSWTPLTVTWKSAAEKYIGRLTAKDREQVREAVRAFAASGVGDLKKLKGQDGYRLRVRDLRIFLEIAWSEKTLTVLSVTPRGDAY